MKSIKTLALVCAAFVSAQSFAQDRDTIAGIFVNYKEANVGTYTLPDPLTLNNGKKVTDAKTWTEKRRPELIKLFEENQYGKMPAKPAAMRFDVTDKGTPALDGKAIRKQISVYFTKDTIHRMDILVYLPAQAKGPVPLFTEISFSPNTGQANDPGIKTSYSWSKDGKRVPARGGFGKIPAIDKYLAAGFGVATICYTDIEPDVLNASTWGIRGQYLKAGQTEPAPDEWGAVSAWAWGLSRAMDYFETDKQIDAKRVAIHGTSRLGKTVLWAGAHDPRIKMVLASCGGEGGAALSRRNYGETIAHLVEKTRYPYQFAGNYAKWAKDPNTSPVDAHELVALMAPRPLLLITGTTDNWSDPKGEWMSLVAAAPVYKLFGKDVPATTEWPAGGDKSYLNTLGYYMHVGGHGAMPGDWDVFLDYMKKFL